MRTVLDLETPHGPARAHLLTPRRPIGAVALGHGAGGGIGAADLEAAAGAANATRFTAVLIEQPYRVAGRRSQPSSGQLDGAWLAVLAALRAGELRGLPLVVGGRSAGARVACRTAEQAEAIAVLCLAFRCTLQGAEMTRRKADSASSTWCACRCWSSRASAIRSGSRRMDRAGAWCASPVITRSEALRRSKASSQSGWEA